MGFPASTLYDRTYHPIPRSAAVHEFTGAQLALADDWGWFAFMICFVNVCV
jgi:hypothetical protein